MSGRDITPWASRRYRSLPEAEQAEHDKTFKKRLAEWKEARETQDGRQATAARATTGMRVGGAYQQWFSGYRRTDEYKVQTRALDAAAIMQTCARKYHELPEEQKAEHKEEYSRKLAE